MSLQPIISFIILQASDLFCCDAQMIEIMDQQIKMATGVFGRCHTCSRNLYKSVCALNCSPRQSDFLVGEKAEVEVHNETGE